MRIIRHFSEPESGSYTGDVCLRLEDSIDIKQVSGDLWLESFNPGLVVDTARKLVKPSLNSLWNDMELWNYYKDFFHLFENIVLVPFDPENPEKTWEQNYEELLKMAVLFNLDQQKIIVDVCIQPFMSNPDTLVYKERAIFIGEEGFKNIGGLDNYVYKQENDVELMHKIMKDLEEYLDYGIIGNTMYQKLGIA